MSDVCQPLTTQTDDGARLEGYRHGGHISRWWPAGSSTSRLWLSGATGCGPGIAIRGGVPVIFPQFGLLGELPKHGYARTRSWDLVASAGGGGALLAFSTTIEDEPQWDGRVRLEIGAHATHEHLVIRMSVANLDDGETTFTAALHTYLTVSDTRTSAISGLAGAAAQDSAAGGAPVALPDDRLPAAGPQDLMIRGVPGPLTLHDATLPDLELMAVGFPDWVVWNPGDPHGLPDVADGDERHFVCIEPAALDPVVLRGGERWEGSLTLRQHA